MIISKLEASPLKTKRYRVYIGNKHYDFGLKGGSTFIDGQSLVTRENYRKRHLGNPIEKHLIDNLILSPALFAFYLLWGETNNLNKNLTLLNQKLADKYKS